MTQKEYFQNIVIAADQNKFELILYRIELLSITRPPNVPSLSIGSRCCSSGPSKTNRSINAMIFVQEDSIPGIQGTFSNCIPVGEPCEETL